MRQARAAQTLTLLADGRVLAAGGSEYSFSNSTASAEIFDPARGTWTLVQPMLTARRGHSAVLLPNGEVLITGGYPGSFSSEIYTPCY